MLDGLSILHMHQMPDLPRGRLIELAITSAQVELTPLAPQIPGHLAAGPT
jgi:hypothetical protein